ncbi:uncharacterized protein LOC110631087 [Manihot esculenta]|uniref:uncharacterized protein LOC110631087 n=1 Tax=Manihot esculenta TaxID=3983 RepID=UPI001CC7FCCA|nr:uncharacterized protein LOC110631087 [Manihot esculenta]XP_043806437.1 uncharacterized protein LOC110631087 [Manihot esculenta]XP_043806438.1 uncharacterized protein LOC110631087 [Manihot esculenta]XP_043806439.1 uncharacterized protein LOC110631087 [Manihot esculenta]
MDCNKEYAFRAKEIAEKKFIERDIAGAKRFAMKAQNLFPGLDGLSQFLATLDVYISAERRTNGEIDCYGILGVDPLADEETIRKHYRKLALILHPDKNKSVGAEGAFKILSEAWSLLSDKAKRIAYDQKQILCDMYRSDPNLKSSTPAGKNGSHYFFSNNKLHTTYQNSALHPKPAPPPHFSMTRTFWTICSFCRAQFEYSRTFVHHTLLCHNCKRPFFAVEVPPPPIVCNGPFPTWSSHMQGLNSTLQTRTKNPYASGMKPVSSTTLRPVVQAGTFGKVGSVESVPSAAPATAGRGEYISKGDRMKKKRRLDEYRMANQMADRNGGDGTDKGSFETGKTNIAGFRTRELSQQELRNMLVEKAKKDIRLRLMECSIPYAVSKISEKEDNKEKGKQKAPLNSMNTDGNKCSEFLNTKTRAQTDSSLANSNDDLDTKGSNASLTMTVPDPDFHDFDDDRTEKSFGDNQVWAAYDDDDGMPRYYAMIHRVISRKPFRMQISWLNSKSNRELGPLNWIGSGFYKTSGVFWIGKHEFNQSINSFSHKVNWEKGTRGTIQIYPRKGDVWALYRNWSPDWNELTPDEVIHNYDMVEVLEDYNKERGVTVAPLVKVAGFKTVFCRHSDSSKTKSVPREELFRLSHQVPFYLLTGQEGLNAPKGCLELDPASMPLELLTVLAEAKEEEVEESVQKAKDPLGKMKKSEEEQLVEDGETKEKNLVKDAAKEDVAEVKRDEGKETKMEKLMVYKRRRQRN